MAAGGGGPEQPHHSGRWRPREGRRQPRGPRTVGAAGSSLHPRPPPLCVRGRPRLWASDRRLCGPWGWWCVRGAGGADELGLKVLRERVPAAQGGASPPPPGQRLKTEQTGVTARVWTDQSPHARLGTRAGPVLGKRVWQFLKTRTPVAVGADSSHRPRRTEGLRALFATAVPGTVRGGRACKTARVRRWMNRYTGRGRPHVGTRSALGRGGPSALP